MTKEKTKFYLNEKLVEANADETIWQVANRLGTEIPHLCYSDKPGYRALSLIHISEPTRPY